MSQASRVVHAQPNWKCGVAELRQAHQPRDAHLHAIIGARLPCGASTPAYTTSIYNMRGVTAALCC